MILEIIMDHAALFHVSQMHFSSNRVHSCLIHRHQPPDVRIYLTVAPNGKSASLAILKNCLPKGIPMIVM